MKWMVNEVAKEVVKMTSRRLFRLPCKLLGVSSVCWPMELASAGYLGKTTQGIAKNYKDMMTMTMTMTSTFVAVSISSAWIMWVAWCWLLMGICLSDLLAVFVCLNRCLFTDCVQINSLLRFHAQIPRLIFDVSLPFEAVTTNTSPPICLSKPCLFEPATYPGTPHLRINCSNFPWILDIICKTTNFVTVFDVLSQLYTSLRLTVSAEEYDAESYQSQRQIATAFHQRVNRDPWTSSVEEKKGLKRVDFLRGRNRFMGLSRTQLGKEVWLLNVLWLKAIMETTADPQMRGWEFWRWVRGVREGREGLLLLCLDLSWVFRHRSKLHNANGEWENYNRAAFLSEGGTSVDANIFDAKDPIWLSTLLHTGITQI